MRVYVLVDVFGDSTTVIGVYTEKRYLDAAREEHVAKDNECYVHEFETDCPPWKGRVE
jgi:hypothetical protein